MVHGGAGGAHWSTLPFFNPEEFSPSLVGCFIWDQNHSHPLIRRSRECVINVPTADIVKTVIDIGNTHGGEIDKFKAFGLTPVRGTKVAAPLMRMW